MSAASFARFYAKTPKIYWTWRNILLRCSSDHPTHFSKYKARGISVCQRWLVFENFLADMGACPPGMSIERKNNDGNYEPENCKWATPKEQSRNRRSVRYITFNQKTQLLADWALELGINSSTLSMRINAYGWSIEKALTTGVKSHAPIRD